MRRIGLVTLVAALAGSVSAQDFSAARVETQMLGRGMYVLFGVGEGVIAGNIVASIGSDGVFIVDDQFPEMIPKIRDTLMGLGGGAIDFAVNTHWHFDHADGNKMLGRQGVRIVAHDVSRRMLLQDNEINLVNTVIEQPRYPREALPVLTYGDTMSFHFNGERIDLMHFGPAHTMGDTAVIFRDSGVVHLGDVFNNAGYPFIDADNGGSLTGIINFCQGVLDQVPRTAIVVPGHGPVSDYAGLAEYVALLSEIRDRMSALIASGASLEQVVAARITAEWDEARGDPGLLLDRAYAGMVRSRTPLR